MKMYNKELHNQVIHAYALDIMHDMADDSVDIILTDPPYDMPQIEMRAYHDEFLRVSKSWIIIFCAPNNRWIQPVDQQLYWIKPISTKNTSKRYSQFVEEICLYGYGIWNAKHHWSNYTNIHHDVVDSTKLHPYRKPPALITRLIRNHTNVGDVVLDPFAGSFVVAEACKQLGRVHISIETSFEYCKQARARLSLIT